MPLLIEAIRQNRCKKILLALQLRWDLNERDPEQLRTPLIELTFLEKEAIAARLCKRFPTRRCKTGSERYKWKECASLGLRKRSRETCRDFDK